MANRCSICNHPQIEGINQAVVAGVPFRKIVEQFGTCSIGALHRHKSHLPAQLAKAHEAKEVAQADSLLDQVRHLADEARDILKNVKESQPATAVQAIRAIANLLELQAKILGEMKSDVTVNVATNVAVTSEGGDDLDRIGAVLDVLVQAGVIPLPGSTKELSARADPASDDVHSALSDASADCIPAPVADKADPLATTSLDPPGECGRVLAVGERLGWPKAALRDGRTIPEGELGWRQFLAGADERTRQLVLEAVSVLTSIWASLSRSPEDAGALAGAENDEVQPASAHAEADGVPAPELP